MLTAYSVTSPNRADGLIWETDVLSKAGRLIPVIKNFYAMCRNSYRALDLRLKDRGFDPRLFHKLFAYVYLCHKPAKFGTVQGAVMPCSWEGNRRSCVALAMRHRLQWFIHLWAHGLSKRDEHPAYTADKLCTTLFLSKYNRHRPIYFVQKDRKDRLAAFCRWYCPWSVTEIMHNTPQ